MSSAASLMRLPGAGDRRCCSRLSFSAKYSLKSSVSRLPPMRPGSAWLIVFLHVRQQHRRIGVEDLAVGEDVASGCRRAAAAGSADRRRDRGSRARTPARAWRRRCAARRRRSPGPATARCASGSRWRSRRPDRRPSGSFRLNAWTGMFALVRSSDRTRRSCCGRCRDRSGGCRGSGTFARRPNAGVVPAGRLRGSSGVDRAADEPVVLLVRDVDQAGQPLVLDRRRRRRSGSRRRCRSAA